MAGKSIVNKIQLGDSATATQNFVLQTNADGSMKLARGNDGATTQDILTVDATGKVAIPNPNLITVGTAVATTSGTAIDFTGIPSWVKRITVSLGGVSTNGLGDTIIQLGKSAGVETSAYVSAAGYISTSANTTRATFYTAGFGLVANGGLANDDLYGSVVLTLLNASTNTWACSGSISNLGNSYIVTLSGIKSLAGTLDRIRLTTVTGSPTFDAGSVNIMYEG